MLKKYQKCHNDISCKTCKGYVHKKCTKLSKSSLKVWIVVNGYAYAQNVTELTMTIPTDSVSDDAHDLNESPHFNVTDVHFTKYDNMILTL